MKQLFLPVDEEFLSKSTEFFVTKCNEEAYNFLITQYDPTNIPFNRIVLCGEVSSGKSRLAKIWLSDTRGLYLNCRSDSLDVRVDKKYTKVVVDNYELADEKELLHIINRCIDNNIIILLTTFSKVRCKLPDLQSRLNSAYQIQIQGPDGAIVLLMLQEMFFINKIRVGSSVIDFIKNHIYFDNFRKLLGFKLQLQRACEDNRMTLNINTLKHIYDNWNRV